MRRSPRAAFRAARWRCFGSCARNRMLNLKYARLIAALFRRRFLTRYGRRLRSDGLSFIAPDVVMQIAPERADRAGPLVVDRARLQAALPRGADLDRRQDRDGPGVHDLRLPARVDRARVRDRRPRDDDRLRPRDGRGGAPDPVTGDLQARRPRGEQRVDRIRGLHPARRDRGRQRRDRHERGGHARRARQRGGRRRAREGDPDARRAAGRCGGSERPALLARGPWAAEAIACRWLADPYEPDPTPRPAPTPQSRH